jgi:hypothetical protein
VTRRKAQTAAAEATGTQAVPAHLAVYVEALGAPLACRFFLELGGSQIYLSQRSGDRSVAAQVIGADKVEQLAARVDYGYIKVPLARQWVARQLRADGKSDNEIARLVRADVATVRRWLATVPRAEQLDLPL